MQAGVPQETDRITAPEMLHQWQVIPLHHNCHLKARHYLANAKTAGRKVWQVSHIATTKACDAPSIIKEQI